MSNDKAFGQIALEAYNESRGAKKVPDWSDLPLESRFAWEEAAWAVVESHKMREARIVNRMMDGDTCADASAPRRGILCMERSKHEQG